MKASNLITLTALLAVMAAGAVAATMTVYNLTGETIDIKKDNVTCAKDTVSPESSLSSLGNTEISAARGSCIDSADFNFWVYQADNESNPIGRIGFHSNDYDTYFNPDNYISSDYSNQYNISEKRYDDSGSNNHHYYSLQTNNAITFNLYSDMTSSVYTNFTTTTGSVTTAIINTSSGNGYYSNSSECIEIEPDIYYIVYYEANAGGDNSTIWNFYQDSSCTTPIVVGDDDLYFTISTDEIYTFDDPSITLLNNSTMAISSLFVNLMSSECGTDGSSLNSENCTVTLANDIESSS